MKIGVYVGSFNPVHIGHIRVANELIANHYLDKIYIVPTEAYWHKTNLISLKHRINMLKLVETDKIMVDTIHNHYQYAYEILNTFKKIYNNDDIYLIIGADLLTKFHLWKEVDQILNYKIIVMNRDNIDVNKYINSFQNKNHFITINDIDELNISSTIIRESDEYMNKYLDKKVLKYIKDNRLYEKNIS